MRFLPGWANYRLLRFATVSLMKRYGATNEQVTEVRIIMASAYEMGGFKLVQQLVGEWFNKHPELFKEMVS